LLQLRRPLVRQRGPRAFGARKQVHVHLGPGRMDAYRRRYVEDNENRTSRLVLLFCPTVAASADDRTRAKGCSSTAIRLL
jgi:hypothetical protein